MRECSEGGFVIFSGKPMVARSEKDAQWMLDFMGDDNIDVVGKAIMPDGIRIQDFKKQRLN